jgi:hypothetical protein
MAAADFFRDVEHHLEYFGYRTEFEGGILKVLQAPPSKPLFWVVPHPQGGAVFRALYRTGPNATTDADGFRRFLNQANSLAVVSRFVGLTDFMSVEAWYPPSYDRESFAIFFGRYLADIAAPAERDLQTVLNFFPPENPAANTIQNQPNGAQS